VFLAGGGASLPYTREFFEEKLHLPVEIFNPLSIVTLGKGVDADRLQAEAHMMGELVGLGLRGIGKAKINVDLVPATVEQSRAAERRKPMLIAAAAILIAGAGAYAAFQTIAANKAADEAKTMSDAKESLAPIQAEISALLKKETELRRISDAYVGAEADRTFWVDAIAELRGAFASDAVWLTEFSPLANHNPSPPPTPEGAPKVSGVGIEIVKTDFTSTVYGSSSMVEVKPAAPAAPAPKGKKAAAAPAEAEGTANAVRIRGLWRENAQSQDIVSALVKKLKESNSTHFKFKMLAADGKTETDIPPEKILIKVEPKADAGEFALPFEIILPLTREVVIK
jgi:hypothetical protein